MLRTIELILGLQPMSQFDAAAMPMFASFQEKPDLTPYTVKPATVDLNDTNAKTAWGGKASQRMDFTQGRRRRRSAAQRDHLALRARRQFPHARRPAAPRSSSRARRRRTRTEP